MIFKVLLIRLYLVVEQITLFSYAYIEEITEL
jgi:hypothetical protein